jgi:hypothetical protein
VVGDRGDHLGLYREGSNLVGRGMSEEGESFKLSSGAETPGGGGDGCTVKVSNATSASATTVGPGVPEMAPIWTPPIPPGEEGPYFYYNPQGSINFPQNGYYFQNYGPQPNMGKSNIIYVICVYEMSTNHVKQLSPDNVSILFLCS